MRFPRRRTVWRSAVLLLVVVAGAWLFAPPSKINRENYKRIREGMTQEEVTLILGEPTEGLVSPSTMARCERKYLWLADTWETLTWYASVCD